MENLALSWFKKINRRLALNNHCYDFTRVVTVSKKNTDKFRIFVSNLYDRIVQKAVYKVFYVIFEGYFYWEKISHEMVSKNYCKVIKHGQIVKKKGRQEY